MAKDKKLLIAKAVMQHIVRKNGGQANATRVGMFIQFIVHPRLLNSESGGGTSGGSATTNSGGAGSVAPVAFGVGVGTSGNAKAQVKTIMTVGGKKVVPKDKSGDRKPRGSGFNSVTSTATTEVASGSSFDGALVHKVFQLPNAVFPSAATATSGAGAVAAAATKTSALIVSKDIAVDCVRINKKYKYYDYVCAIESIQTEGYGADETTIKRAAVVGQTFQRFVVDRRCVGGLPRSIQALMQQDQRLASGLGVKKAAHQNSNGGSGSQSSVANLARDEIETATREGAKSITLLDLRKEGSLEGEDLPFLLGQGAKGQALLVSERDGRCLLRVGHAGMAPGEVTANITNFTNQFKSLYPTIFRSVTEYKLISCASEPIRYMATNAAQ